jgi:hypothetical protein
MPRPKGRGAIKFLDAKRQDAVAMRRVLWRGHTARTPQEKELEKLVADRAKQTVRLSSLKGACAYQLRESKDCENPSGRVIAKMKLRDVEPEIDYLETALRSMEQQIKQIGKKVRRSRRRKAVFPWQEMAGRLIELHSYVGAGRGPVVIGDQQRNSKVCTTAGATISARELQKQLRAAGFKVGDRELRRFVRRCGVKGKQGARTDLAR